MFDFKRKELQSWLKDLFTPTTTRNITNHNKVTKGAFGKPKWMRKKDGTLKSAGVYSTFYTTNKGRAGVAKARKKMMDRIRAEKEGK